MAPWLRVSFEALGIPVDKGASHTLRQMVSTSSWLIPLGMASTRSAFLQAHVAESREPISLPVGGGLRARHAEPRHQEWVHADRGLDESSGGAKRGRGGSIDPWLCNPAAAAAATEAEL